MKKETNGDQFENKESKMRNINEIIDKRVIQKKKNPTNTTKTSENTTKRAILNNIPAIRNQNMECPICFELFSVSFTPGCSHSICLLCFLRLCVFMKSKDCVVCRFEIDFVLIQGDILPLIKKLTGLVIAQNTETGNFFTCASNQNDLKRILLQKNGFQEEFANQKLIYTTDLDLNISTCEWIRTNTKKEKAIQNFKKLIEKKEIKIYRTTKANKLQFDSTHVIYQEFPQNIDLLLSHTCKQCFSQFSSRSLLISHYSQTHKKFLCNLCIFNKPVFWYEYQIFTEMEYKNHISFWNNGNIKTPQKSRMRRINDFVGTSQSKNKKPENDKNEEGFIGHPTCPFCNLQVYGLNDLHLHLHSNYHLCTLCEVNNHRSIFYKNFSSLQKHNECHYSCYLCKDFFFYKSQLVHHLQTAHKIRKRMEEIKNRELQLDGYDFNRVRSLQGKKDENESETVKKKDLNPIQNVQFPSFSNQTVPEYLNVSRSDNLRKTLFLRLKNVLRKIHTEKLKSDRNLDKSLDSFSSEILNLLNEELPVGKNYENLAILKPKERISVLKECARVYSLNWTFEKLEKEANFPSFGSAPTQAPDKFKKETKKEQNKEIVKKFKVFTFKRQ